MSESEQDFSLGHPHDPTSEEIGEERFHEIWKELESLDDNQLKDLQKEIERILKGRERS